MGPMRVLEAIISLVVVVILSVLIIITVNTLTRSESRLIGIICWAIVGFVTVIWVYQGKLDEERAGHRAEMEWAEENLKKAHTLSIMNHPQPNITKTGGPITGETKQDLATHRIESL